MEKNQTNHRIEPFRLWLHLSPTMWRGPMGLTDQLVLGLLGLPQTPETARSLRESLRQLQRALEEVDLAIVNADGLGYHLESTRERRSWPDPQLVVLALIKYGLMEPDLVPDGFLSPEHDSSATT